MIIIVWKKYVVYFSLITIGWNTYFNFFMKFSLEWILMNQYLDSQWKNVCSFVQWWAFILCCIWKMIFYFYFWIFQTFFNENKLNWKLKVKSIYHLIDYQNWTKFYVRNECMYIVIKNRFYNWKCNWNHIGCIWWYKFYFFENLNWTNFHNQSLIIHIWHVSHDL